MLLDCSRLVWRLWRGGALTGIDRVCLAYVEHYRHRALAVVQYKGRFRTLAPEDSRRFFDLIGNADPNFRMHFLRVASAAFARAREIPKTPGLTYLNVGHTGLDAPALPQWVSESKVRAVYFVHDLIPLLHPEYCRPGEYPKHERRMKNVLVSATALIGNSQATLESLATFARSRDLPAPSGLAAWIAGSPASHEVKPKAFDRPHFIVVGTIEGRKNHSLLLHVWQRFARQFGAATPTLVIVGQRGWEASHAQAMLNRSPELAPHVLELSRCGDAEMAALIAGARALLMPSFAEGFGLPVAEALELGTPVIASNLPVFREFARDIPTYLDPLDGPAWQKTILDFLADGPERARQLEAMRSFRPPTWADHFRRVDDWLAEL